MPTITFNQLIAGQKALVQSWPILVKVFWGSLSVFCTITRCNLLIYQGGWQGECSRLDAFALAMQIKLHQKSKQSPFHIRSRSLWAHEVFKLHGQAGQSISRLT